MSECKKCGGQGCVECLFVPQADVPARLREKADTLETCEPICAHQDFGQQITFLRLLADAYEALPAGHPLLSRIEEAAR